MNNKNPKIIIEEDPNIFLFEKNQSKLKISFNRISFIFFIFFIIFIIYSIHLLHLGSRSAKAKLTDTSILSSDNLYRADIIDRNGRYLSKTVSSIDIGISTKKVIDKKRLIINLKYIFPDKDFKKIKSVTWFKTPKNPTDFEFWEGDNILEDLVREDVIEILSEEGDAWILEIFELVRGIDAASKWGKSEILDLQEAIIKSAPTEGLRRMSEAILIGKTSF